MGGRCRRHVHENAHDEQCINQIVAELARRDVSTRAWCCGLSPIDSVSTAASSPRKDRVKNYRWHPTHWLICEQATKGISTVKAQHEQGFNPECDLELSKGDKFPHVHVSTYSLKTRKTTNYRI